ncbi:hypothetical protein ACLOJK_013557, partial [Asimina triloba]
MRRASRKATTKEFALENYHGFSQAFSFALFFPSRIGESNKTSDFQDKNPKSEIQRQGNREKTKPRSANDEGFYLRLGKKGEEIEIEWIIVLL